MRTGKFLKELERYGWKVARRGGSHWILKNEQIPVARPLVLSYSDTKEIDLNTVDNCTKRAGLYWDWGLGSPRPNPRHPFYPIYKALHDSYDE